LLEIGATSVHTTKISLRSKIAFLISISSFSLLLFCNPANATSNNSLQIDPLSSNSQNNADFDNDGLTDQQEEQLGTERYLADTDGDGISDGVEVGDNPLQPHNHDNDNRIDALDSDDDNDGLPTLFEQQQDYDKDGIPDYLDTDSDNDGISDGEEAGMALQDSDHDGIDNRVDVDNTGSKDKNGDGIDDQFHFPDRNKNGKPDFLDKSIQYVKVKIPSDNILAELEKNADILEIKKSGIVPTKEGKIEISLTQDQDHDGIPDLIEMRIGTNPKQRDSDHDLVPDAVEIGLILEYPQDTDHDGIIDALDDDDDNDGVLTRNEDPNLDGLPLNDDTDNDGVPNYQDANDDGDMTITRDEGSTLDTDKDGVLDYLDKDDGVDRSMAILEKR
jgi:hypothetical protein